MGTSLIKLPKRKNRAGRPTRYADLNDASPLKLMARMEAGFEFSLLISFQKTALLSVEEIGDLVRIPLRTLSRRKREGKLRADESERLWRAIRVVDKAVALFEGNKVAAMQWLQTPQPALELRTPLQFARSDVGAREVEELIGRLEHGVFT